ncbi:MAG TPA: hypothetical protein VL371_20760, partial [Gemmataceae bacterium]|nr:hypothetical protein [Gemmataceae bacterium]
MRSHSARRPWYARARALFSSLSELRNPRQQPARTRLGVTSLEDRIYPSITPLGEFAVPTTTANDQDHPAVAADAAGDFLAVWHRPGPAGGEGIYGQRFNAIGSPVGAEFMANENPYSSYYSTAVAMAPDGRAVITWYAYDQTDGGVNSWKIFARLYNADGTPHGAEFKVNTVSTGLQSDPAVAMAADGSFVIAFVDQRDYVDPYMEIAARRFDADGNGVGSQFPVNTTTAYNQYAPSIGMDAAADFVIGWTSQFQDGMWNGVFARAFSA